MLVNRMLTDVLGFDEFGELPTEYAVYQFNARG
jgi:hypothetical protein